MNEPPNNGVNMAIEERFSNGQWSKNVQNVGELMDELSRLPRDLPTKVSLSESVDLVVFNRNTEHAHLSFEGGGEWDDPDTQS